MMPRQDPFWDGPRDPFNGPANNPQFSNPFSAAYGTAYCSPFSSTYYGTPSGTFYTTPSTDPYPTPYGSPFAFAHGANGTYLDPSLLMSGYGLPGVNYFPGQTPRVGAQVDPHYFTKKLTVSTKQSQHYQT